MTNNNEAAHDPVTDELPDGGVWDFSINGVRGVATGRTPCEGRVGVEVHDPATD